MAAEALHISQPALSRRIEKLEKSLGSRLLDRTTRRVETTNIGRQFLDIVIGDSGQLTSLRESRADALQSDRVTAGYAADQADLVDWVFADDMGRFALGNHIGQLHTDGIQAQCRRDSNLHVSLRAAGDNHVALNG